MAGYTGMDITQVRGLSTQMRSASGEIRGLMQRLSGQLGSTTWVGPDRQRFESEWNSSHVANLNRVCDALDQAAEAADRNAADQEATSS